MYALIKPLMVLFLLHASFAKASILDELIVFPGAEVVDVSDDRNIQQHLIVLGALEKINHELEPERSTFLVGKKSTRTYYLPVARKTGDVEQFYGLQLADIGTLVFSCTGRTCGSSSYWANKILNQAILYGPEQFQRYGIYELPDGAGYVSFYASQRATRKIYVHIEAFTAVSDQIDK